MELPLSQNHKCYFVPGRDIGNLDGLGHSLLLVLAPLGPGGGPLVLRLGGVDVLEFLIVL